MAKITINDVAAKANVSPATVSRVLNGGSVKEDLIQRTYAAIEALGYEVKTKKKHNGTQEVPLMGVIVPEIASPFYSEIIAGIMEVASANGYELLIRSSFGKQARERENLEALAKTSISALIYYPIATIESIYEIPLYKKIPVVIGGRQIKDETFSTGYLATKYLARLGRKKIVYLGPIHDLEKPIMSFEEFMALQDEYRGFYVSMSRFQGYQKALAEEHIEFRPELVKLSGYRWQDGYEIARELITQMIEVDAIVAANDVVATGILKFLKEQGIRVPEDISIIGYDNRTVAVISQPLLTTIDQDAALLGKTCVASALKHMEEGSTSEVVLDVSLVVRHSTCVPSKIQVNV